MRIASAAIGILALTVLTGADTGKSGGGSEWKKMEGKWNMQQIVFAGRVAEDKPFDERIFVFKDGHLKCSLTHNPKGFQVQLNESTKPKSVDLVDATTILKRQGGSEEQKSVVQGIYRFDGDNLLLSLAAPGEKERPREFDSKAGSKIVAVTLTRKMPAADSDEVRKHDLLGIGIWYFSHESATGKTPASMDELKPYIDESGQETAERVKKGDYVVAWNADFNSIRRKAPRGKSIEELGKYILAYEASAPEKGGWVLTGDFGKPRKMTAKDFKECPKFPAAK